MNDWFRFLIENEAIRNGFIMNEMQPTGLHHRQLPIYSSRYILSLTYTYPTNSNRLTSITDLASISLVPTTANRPKGFNQGLGGTGYTYDTNDNRMVLAHLKQNVTNNMSQKQSHPKWLCKEGTATNWIAAFTIFTYKGITNITYNYLNLPTKIEWGTTKSIEFTYTAAGEKVEKRVKTGVNTDYLQTYEVCGSKWDA